MAVSTVEDFERNRSRRAEIGWFAALVLFFYFGSTLVTPVPARAHFFAAEIRFYYPVLNSFGNVYFKTQYKITGCNVADCRPDGGMKVWSCGAAWDGDSYFQLGDCKIVSKSKSQLVNNQLTVTKTLTGGCNPSVRYGTKGKGYADDDGTLWYLPQPPGSFGYGPSSGGWDVC
jgi:hypothetical protein